MSQIHREYLTDENGNKKAVVIPLAEWQKIIEELDDIKAYDKAKSVNSDCAVVCRSGEVVGESV